MAFSGALTLTDLNDFITPAQACIKPVEQTNKVEPQDPGAASTQIQVDSSGLYYEVSADGVSTNKSGQRLETAQISLNDCLACSGCITSAESVLITLQSHTEVLNFLASNPEPSSKLHKVPVLSIAPQCLASLAASLSSSSSQPVDLARILRRVEAFCKEALGFEHVYDTTFARHISLLEHAKEFAERKRGEGPLPMLASACPGWVCYAEKTHAEMLPFISRTKSPQQVMGTLVKEWLAPQWGKHPDKVYHVAVMPCYDKKLEASRQDFYNEAYATRDVDCVLTTGELELLMRERAWDLSVPVPGEARAADPNGVPALLAHPGTSSGSYMQALLAAQGAGALAVRTVRGADYEEHTLADAASGAVLFRGAKCYGFRNLQNVVRKVGREAGVQAGGGEGAAAGEGGEGGEAGRGYDYVEVMACPGGCVNGGGQLRPPAGVLAQRKEDEEGYAREWADSGVKDDADGGVQAIGAKWGDKEWTKKVEEAYWRGVPPTSHDTRADECLKRANEMAARALVDLCRPKDLSHTTAEWSTQLDDEAEARRRRFFRTQYRAVESEVVGLAVKW
ncbi:iron hydrogenase [Amylocystis lapponica]|nr:iron hydrogenase [Amylocystis lapponica]